jgi:hypothetical protein
MVKNLKRIEKAWFPVSMANCYFAKPHSMQHYYIPFNVIDFKRVSGFGEAQPIWNEEIFKSVSDELYLKCSRAAPRR